REGNTQEDCRGDRANVALVTPRRTIRALAYKAISWLAFRAVRVASCATLSGIGRCCRARAIVRSASHRTAQREDKAAFLARARALRDQAVREGDQQAYGADLVCDGIIVGKVETTSFCTTILPRT